MANHKSSEKRIRSTKTRRESNRYFAKTVRNSVKTVRAEAGSDETKKNLPLVISSIDKLARKKVIHRNKAANLKSKLMKKITAPSQPKA